MAGVDSLHLFIQVLMPLQDILLMIILGHGKGAKRQYFRFNRMTESFLNRGFGSHCQSALRFVVIEDHIHVLLRPCSRGRLVAFPENVQQLGIRDALGVVVDLYGLCVVTDVVIGRSGRAAAGISYAGADDAFDDPEPGFDSPESAQPEGCRFKNGRCRCIDGRDLCLLGFGFICRMHVVLLGL